VPSKIAASAAWADDSTLVMHLALLRNTAQRHPDLQFEGDGVTITFLNSITAMNPKAKDTRAPLKRPCKHRMTSKVKRGDGEPAPCNDSPATAATCFSSAVPSA
jgi:hypothetical protein